jgi:hypothetical protein
MKLKNKTDLFITDSRKLLLTETREIDPPIDDFTATRMIQGAENVQQRTLANARLS